MPEINKQKAMERLQEIKSLCYKTIEEINKNNSSLSYNKAGAIELENLNQQQKKDDLENQLEKLAKLNEDFYNAMYAEIKLKSPKQETKITEIINDFKEQFDLVQKLALKSGLLKEETFFHKIFNDFQEFIIDKLAFFLHSSGFINSADISLTDTRKAMEADNYTGPNHKKLSKMLNCMFFSDKKMEAEKQVPETQFKISYQ